MRLDWRRPSAVLRALAVVAAALLFHTPAGASTIPVSGPPVYTNPGPAPYSDPFAAGTWLRNNVRAGSSVGVSNAIPHNGTGSIYFSGADGVSKADLEYYGAPVSGRLGDLTSVGYDWFRDAASTNPGAQAPALRLYVDVDGNLATTGDVGFLIYEPVYNGFGPNVPTDTWTTSAMSLTSGNFWWRFGGVNLEIFNRTIQDQINAAVNGLNANSLVVGISVGVGSGWNGSYVMAADGITIGYNGNANTFQFNGPAEVPEPATLALFGLGAVGVLALRRRKAAAA